MVFACIYNAYKILVENCDSDDIKKNLHNILIEIDNKLISKESLSELLIDQSNIMKEFNDINYQLKEIFPNYL